MRCKVIDVTETGQTDNEKTPKNLHINHEKNLGLLLHFSLGRKKERPSFLFFSSLEHPAGAQETGISNPRHRAFRVTASILQLPGDFPLFQEAVPPLHCRRCKQHWCYNEWSTPQQPLVLSEASRWPSALLEGTARMQEWSPAGRKSCPVAFTNLLLLT